MTELPKLGECVKVCLPGETPWAEVIAVNERTFIGKIVNKLYREFSEIEKAKFLKDGFGTVKQLPELHKYKFGDEITFRRDENDLVWEPDL